jgi:hypothetical protein
MCTPCPSVLYFLASQHGFIRSAAHRRNASLSTNAAVANVCREQPHGHRLHRIAGSAGPTLPTAGRNAPTTLTRHRKLIGAAVLVFAAFVLAVVMLIVVLAQVNARHTVGGLKVGQGRCIDTIVSDPDTTDECGRLTSFATQLLDQAPHAPIASVALYREPPSGDTNTLNLGDQMYGGYHDFAIVSFKLSDDTEQAFYVRCGIGIAKELCFDLRPSKPGEAMDQQVTYPNPVAVP